MNNSPAKKQKDVPFYKRGFIYRPVPTITSTTLCFLISGIIFVIIGAVLLYLSNSIKEYTIRYDILSDCDNALKLYANKTCTIEINLDDVFTPPVMVYYQLENFYQGHRRYIKSKSIDQLAGKSLTLDQISTDCDPILTMKDIGIYKSVDGSPFSQTDVANPCGLIAKSLFNDTFKLTYGDEEIHIDETNIAWDSDKKGDRYVRAANWQRTQWTDVENEHFMVWMRPAGLPDFRKLWGRINTTLTPGNYKLIIHNNYPVESFSGKKSFVLSTVNALGGRNNFLGIAYLVVGSISVVMALLFWVGYKNYNSDRQKLN
jgi:hypothetical protein